MNAPLLLQRATGGFLLVWGTASAAVLFQHGLSGLEPAWVALPDTPASVYLGFLLVGFGLLAAERSSSRRWATLAAGCLGLLAIVCAGVSLAAGVSPLVPAGGLVHRLAGIPLYAAAAFLLFAWVLARAASSRSVGNAPAVSAAILAAGSLGAGAAIVTFLRLNLLYPRLTVSDIGYPVALGVIAAATGLWLHWRRTRPPRDDLLTYESERIALMGGAILIVIAIASGVVGFASQQKLIEAALGDSLLIALKNRIAIFQTVLESRVASTAMLANRTQLTQAVSEARRASAGAPAAAELESLLRQLAVGPVTGLAVLDADKRMLASTGKFADRSAIQADLGLPNAAHLLWENELILHTRSTISHQGVEIGTLEAQQRLPELTAHLFETTHAGETGEIVLCTPSSGGLTCFPRRFHRQVFTVALHSANGQTIPMANAVDGRTDVVKTLDGRDREVIAAFGPVTPFRLGMVVKQETRELYRPIRRQLNWLLPALLCLAGVGALLLRHRIKPLVARLVQSEQAAKENEWRMRTIIDHVGEGILTFDTQGRIHSFNGTASTIFGHSRAEALSLTIHDLVPATMQPLPEALVRQYLRGQSILHGTGRGIELVGLHRSGRRFFLELTVTETRIGGEHLLAGIVHDISERKQAETRILEEKESLQATLNSIGDAVGDAVITTDLHSHITYLNPVAVFMTGWDNNAAQGLPLQKVFRTVEESTGLAAPNPVLQVLRDGRVATSNNNLLERPDGSRFLVEMSAAPIRDRRQQMIGVSLIFRDVTEARRVAVQLAHQASHDALTGLLNRREFERRLEATLMPASAQEHPFGHALLYCDLDQFKIVNDTCGHAAGDEMLRQLASVLRETMRAQDTLARLGGDEFGVLLQGCSPAQAIRLADGLRQTIAEFRFIWQDKVFAGGVSMGMVHFRGGDLTLADLFRTADAACYVAKDKGRNRIHVYAPDDKELSQRRGEIGWVARIRKALDERRFLLYSQKILPLDRTSGEPPHHELLLRMRDEEGRLVMPMAFIPAAERYGLMPQIDRWVIRTAFAEFASQATAGEIYAINLSATSIADEGFLDFVVDEISQHRITPQRICFEITETAAITNLSQAAALIRELKELGCLIALDDFGSGMSSFAYLKHLPVDYLKIDGAFVKDMLADPIDHAMVESINHIGHVMGIKTIAEFGENEAIMNALRRIGVDFAQGHGVGKPLPPPYPRPSMTLPETLGT